MIAGNIISNQNQASKYGINTNSGTSATNNILRGIIESNTFYNNTSNALNLTVGTSTLRGHSLDDSTGVDPGFTAQSTENYAIGTTMQGAGFPTVAFLQTKSGQTTGVQNYTVPGAVNPLRGAKQSNGIPGMKKGGKSL